MHPYLFITPTKARETYCANAYISELPPLLNHMPPGDSIGINWKRRKYNLDCREVARGTQSAFHACVPIVPLI